MWRYADNLRGLYETPRARSDADAHPGGRRARSSPSLAPKGRTLLDEHESKAILASYGIPTVPTRVARDESEAVAAARELGFPVAVKLWSRTITHKTDVGRRQAGPGRRRRRGAGLPGDQSERCGQGRRAHFLGVTVQPSVDRRARLELILGQLARSPVRSRAALRNRRRAGRDLPRSRPGPAAAQHDAGAALMEQTRISPRARRRARPRAGRSRCAGRACWSASATWSSRIRGSARSTSTRCSRRANGLLALDARVVLARPADRRRRASAAGDPTVSDRVRLARAAARRNVGRHPAHSSRRRAAGDRLSSRR